jgi:voltage-gated potassium channel
MQTPPSAPRLARRSVDRFISQPSSIRNATLVLINVTVLIVLAGSVIVWVFDHEEFPDFGTAIWYTLQTVTTVGYGDVTPTTLIGRSIGGIVMVVAVALLTIINALITSILIEASQRRRQVEELEHDRAAQEQLLGQLALLNQRLERIEARTAPLRERLQLDEAVEGGDAPA